MRGSSGNAEQTTIFVTGVTGHVGVPSSAGWRHRSRGGRKGLEHPSRKQAPAIGIDPRVADYEDEPNKSRIIYKIRGHRALGFGDIAAYSMISSTRERKRSGIARSMAFAAFALTTSSNLLGCSIGKSRGFAPLRIWAT
jgi:hypothetical protein